MKHSETQITNILTRGVEDVFVKDSLEEKLTSGKTLRVKLGVDPTGPKLHLGRAITLRKLRAFQELGHTAIFIVGDFTAQIGDPSDKLQKRPMLTQEEIATNMEHYKEQVGRIIDLERAEFHYNSTWLSQLTLAETTKLAESFSVQQMLARRNFKTRIEAEEDISLREFLYPLMQGYDSVAVKADVEIGGFDQLFNLKAGRIIQRFYGQPEQDVLTTTMLEGTDGRKMSTSWGNVITIQDEPQEMFGKLMSVTDELITKYFLLCTDIPQDDIAAIDRALAAGENPREYKLQLAETVVAEYHGSTAAKDAKEAFIETFSKGGVPADIPEISIEDPTPLLTILDTASLIDSKSDFRRLIKQGAITNMTTEEKVADPHYRVEETTTFRIGKHRFIRIIVEA